MNIKQILAEYDSLFGNTTLDEIEAYLYEKIGEAVKEQDDAAIITLLNEMIGLCRDTSQKDKAIAYCEQLKKLMAYMKLQGTRDYATSMQNIANAYRAFGFWDEAKEAYKIIEKTYEAYLDKGDYLWASMYNNWGLLYQEKNDFSNAVQMLEKALELIIQIPDNEIKVAITKTNLANSLFGLKTDEALKKGYVYLTEALEIFYEDGERDFHYGAALVAMGDFFIYNKQYKSAKAYYQKGIVEILIHTGKTEFYNRVVEKYDNAIAMMDTANNKSNKWKNNLELSRKFYEEHGKNMIHNLFPEYESRIAVGMAGEGSDCYGFDDIISTDHDYAVGFCMWLTKEDMDAIGSELQEAYEKLILEHSKSDFSNTRLEIRRGVFEIEEFYSLKNKKVCEQEKEGICNQEHRRISNKETDISYSSEKYKNYLQDSQEYRLSEMVNGEVFKDDLGLFTEKRNELLKYYPEDLWRRKLANYLHEFSQYGQSNYARMMARQDYLTANLCISKAIESAMDIAYVLIKEYAPYYKWKRKGLEKSGKMRDILWICEEISKLPCQEKAWENKTYSSTELNTEDKCIVLIETLARIILDKMRELKLVKGKDAFLENYIGQILEGDTKLTDKMLVGDRKLTGKMLEEDIQMSDEIVNGNTQVLDEIVEGNKQLINKIVELEWKQFDKVKNEGGRASCQDDFATFSIMRKSQYLTWNEVLLYSYCNDLTEATQNGWNLITEKYARMMKSTAPEKYAELEDKLPVRSEEREKIMEEIVKIQVAWMEEFASKYPNMAVNARTIHTYEDSEFDTSYETYLRGELGTYSEETFVLYGRFIAGLIQEGKNLAYETMNNTAKFYGYESVEDAEEKIGSLK